MLRRYKKLPFNTPPITPRKPPETVRYVSTPYASMAPPEVLLPIFQALGPTVYTDAFAYPPYRTKHQSFAYFDEAVVYSGPNLTDLVSVALVCRSWNASAVAVLYARPFIFSHRRLQQFYRTLQHNTELGTLVTHLYVFTQQCEQAKSRSFLQSNQDSKDRHRARTTLISSILLCPKLTFLLLTNRDRKKSVVLPLDAAFIRSCSLEHRLRSLTIYGSALWTTRGVSPLISPDLFLPALEVLILREVTFHGGLSFPIFPRLHSLQLTRCTYMQTPFGEPRATRVPPFLLTTENFPTVHTLLLYENYCTIDLSEELTGNLKELHCVGADLSRPALWPMNFAPPLLRRLVTSLVSATNNSLSETLPPSLQELTLILITESDLRGVAALANKIRLAVSAHSCPQALSLAQLRSVTIIEQVADASVMMGTIVAAMLSDPEFQEIAPDRWVRASMMPVVVELNELGIACEENGVRFSYNVCTRSFLAKWIGHQLTPR